MRGAMIGLLALVLPVAAAADSPFPDRYLCSDGALAVDLRLTGTGARLRVGASYLDLLPAADDPAAFARSEEPVAALRMGAGHLDVTLPGGALVCQPDPDAPDVTAGGNEPPWQLTYAEGHARLQVGYESALRANGAMRATGDGGFAIGGTALTVRQEDRVTRDSMSGLPYPFAVTVTGPEGTLTGAGGAADALVNGLDWRVIAQDAQPLPDDLTQEVLFTGERIAGSAGCNRIIGRAEITGEGLRLGPLGTTMMACPEPVMAAERAFLDILNTVTTHDFAPNGDLLLQSGADTRLRLRAVLLMP